ncbi:hypothetical protein ACKI16_29300 [Streptomyces scabiei]|uniref:hypothetical protein n=1 Tax=Streptomyces scabiei TaxID=1930 RepID=UPI0038F7D078
MDSVKATVGRAVHYVSHGTPVRPDGSQAYRSVCRAATVTEVDPDQVERVGLAVHNPTGTFFRPLEGGGCMQDEPKDGRRPEGGTWHWPERI